MGETEAEKVTCPRKREQGFASRPDTTLNQDTASANRSSPRTRWSEAYHEIPVRKTG